MNKKERMKYIHDFIENNYIFNLYHDKDGKLIPNR